MVIWFDRRLRFSRFTSPEKAWRKWDDLSLKQVKRKAFPSILPDKAACRKRRADWTRDPSSLSYRCHRSNQCHFDWSCYCWVDCATNLNPPAIAGSRKFPVEWWKFCWSSNRLFLNLQLRWTRWLWGKLVRCLLSWCREDTGDRRWGRRFYGAWSFPNWCILGRRRWRRNPPEASKNN